MCRCNEKPFVEIGEDGEAIPPEMSCYYQKDLGKDPGQGQLGAPCIRSGHESEKMPVGGVNIHESKCASYREL